MAKNRGSQAIEEAIERPDAFAPDHTRLEPGDPEQLQRGAPSPPKPAGGPPPGYNPPPVGRVVAPQGEGPDLPEERVKSGRIQPSTDPADLDIPAPAFGQSVRTGQQSSQTRVLTPNIIRERPAPEEAIEAPEATVVVRPNTTFDTFIGHHRYYFRKGETVTVPVSVKEILAHAGRIYP